MYNILVADDEKEIIRLIKIYMEAENFHVVSAIDGDEAVRKLNTGDIDLAIVDIMMPGKNGYQVIKHIRAGKYIPIIVISAKTALSDKVLGLDLGADDYITKPFEPLEVVARVKAQLRSHCAGTNVTEEKMLSVGEVSLDLHEYSVCGENGEMELTKVEFEVLRLFMSQPKRVFTKEQIYKAGWDDETYVDDNTIRVIISRLREKVGAEHIKTIRGLGYRYEK